MRPDGSDEPAIARLKAGHRAGRPASQSEHVPHPGAHESTTSSPTDEARHVGARPLHDPGSLVPEDDGVGRAHSPLTLWRSVPQIPTAAIRTTTSPAPGLVE